TALATLTRPRPQAHTRHLFTASRSGTLCALTLRSHRLCPEAAAMGEWASQASSGSHKADEGTLLLAYSPRRGPSNVGSMAVRSGDSSSYGKIISRSEEHTSELQS